MVDFEGRIIGHVLNFDLVVDVLGHLGNLVRVVLVYDRSGGASRIGVKFKLSIRFIRSKSRKSCGCLVLLTHHCHASGFHGHFALSLPLLSLSQPNLHFFTYFESSFL